MGAEDIRTFLASVGSPLAEGNDAKKVLPASAVLKLLNAQIETITASKKETGTGTETSEPSSSSIELDEELRHALLAYAKATAQYSYTSAIPALASPLVDALKCTIRWRQALASKDYAGLPDQILACQDALQLIGIHLDLSHQRVDMADVGSMSRSATVAQIATMVKSLMSESHEQLMQDWKDVLHVTSEKNRVNVCIKTLAMASGQSRDAWLFGMWKLMCAMNCARRAMDAISAMLESEIIEPLLDRDQYWQLSSATNEASGAEIEVLVQESHAEKLDGSAVKALIAILKMLHDKLFVHCNGNSQENSEWDSTQNMLSEIRKRIVPHLLVSFKSYLLRGLSESELSLQHFQSTCEAIRKIAIQFHSALIEYDYAREASRSLIMKRSSESFHAQPQSDLDQWTVHIDALLHQQRQGNILSEVRAIIVRTDDKAWDSVTIKHQAQIAESCNEEVRAPARTQRNLPEQPLSRILESSKEPQNIQQKAKEKKHSLLKDAPIDASSLASSTEAPVTSKRKKKTLGAVQRLGAAHSSSKESLSVKVAQDPKPAASFNENKHESVSASSVRTPSVSELENDDWGWGDDDDLDTNPDENLTTEPRTVKESDNWDMNDPWDDNANDVSFLGTSSAKHKQQATLDNEKETSWNSGDEVESSLQKSQDATIALSGTENQQPAHLDDDSNEDSFDAWDWDDSEDEVEISQVDQHTKQKDAGQNSESLPDGQEPQIKSVSYVVTHRCLAIIERVQEELNILPIGEDSRLLRNVCDSILESFQLYRILMPVTHASSLQHVPVLTMLFANDCDYIANTIQDRINPKLSKRSSEEVSNLMLALRKEAQKLQELGTLWQAAQLDLQIYTLQECLDQADGFVGTDQDARNVVCERVIAQVDHILQHLLNVWKSVVMQSVLVGLLGKLVQAVYTRVQTDIEELEDISEVESHRLAVLCRTLLEAQTAMFAQAADCDAESAGALAATVVPSWFKFSYLPELLTGTLADIEYLLFDSGGALLDYETGEITALIRALFADTTNRRRLLDRVQRSL